MDGSLPYLAAGFALTWIAVAAYAWRLESRLGRVRKRLRRHGESASRVGAAGGASGGEPRPAHSNDRSEDEG